MDLLCVNIFQEMPHHDRARIVCASKKKRQKKKTRHTILIPAHENCIKIYTHLRVNALYLDFFYLRFAIREMKRIKKKSCVMISIVDRTSIKYA